MRCMKNKTGIRMIGGLLLFAFFITQNAQAAPLNLPVSSPSDAVASITRNFPESLGKIKAFHQGTGEGMIIHIQDAHANFEVQRHIAEILRYLKNSHKINLIHTEGSSGEIWHRLISGYPDREARALTADYFLREGLVTGPEYEAIANSSDLVLHGVEDKELYDMNREIFLRTLEIQEKDLPVLAKIRGIMEGTARFVYPEDYRRLKQYEKEFLEEGKSFVAYVRFLSGLLDKFGIQGAYPQIKNLSALSEMKKQTEESRRIAGSLGVDIFTEIRSAEESLKEKILVTEEAKRLDGLFQVLSVYEKLFELAWTKEDADFFYNRPGSFRPKAFAQEIRGIMKKHGFKETLPDTAFLDTDLPLMENFYSLALKRDQALVSNALEDMKKRKASSSVLITGGFHTPGIEKTLQKSGYSYLVVMPNAGDHIDEEKDREKYLKAMGVDAAPLNVLLKASVQDPRFQLNAPSSLPTLDGISRIPGEALTDFRFEQLVGEHHLGLLLSGVILNLINAVRLRGASVAVAETGFRPVTDAEKPFVPFYAALNASGTFFSDGASGVYLTQPLGSQGLSIKGYWHPENKRDRNLVLRTEARALMSDGSAVEIGIADRDDRAMIETKIGARKSRNRGRAVARSESRTTAAPKGPGSISALARMVYGPESSEMDTTLFLLAGAVDKMRQQIMEAFRMDGVTLNTPVVIRAHHVLADGRKVAVLPAGEESAERVYHFIFQTPQGRKNFVLRINRPQYVVNELKNRRKTDVTWNFRPYTPELNRLDNLMHNMKGKDGKAMTVAQIFAQIGVKLQPYSTIYVSSDKGKPVFRLRPETEKEPVMEIQVARKEEVPSLVKQAEEDKPAAVNTSEYLGDTYLLIVRLSKERALEALRKLQKQMKSPLPKGVTLAGMQALGLQLFRRITGEDGSGVLMKGKKVVGGGEKKVVDGGARSELRCGNASIQSYITSSQDLERNLGRLGQSIMITEVRGKISMGFYAVLEDEKGNRKIVFEKYIIWKRQQAQDAYADFQKKVRTAARSMRSSYKLMIGMHLRWPTGGALEKDMYVEEIEAGAHPHQWLGINAITHNGDFNDLIHKGRKYSNDVVGWRLKRVLKKANNTTGDSPKAAGEFDLRLVQGKWKSVPRFAYDTAVIDGFEDYFGGKIPANAEEEAKAPSTVLTDAEEQALAAFLEASHKRVAEAEELEDLAEIDEETLQSHIRAMIGEISKAKETHPAAAVIFKRWGMEKARRFVAAGVTGYYRNNSYNVWKEIMINFRGSAGINAYSPSSANRLVAVSLISPIYIGWGMKYGELQVGSFSERNAARVEGYEYILKLDSLGEVAEISHDGKEVKIKVFSLSTGEELTLEELKRRGRIKPAKPLVPLTPAEKADPIAAEQRKLPRNLEVTNKEWKGQPTKEVPQPHNVKVGEEFASVLFRNTIGKRILRGIRVNLQRGYLDSSIRQRATKAAAAFIETHMDGDAPAKVQTLAILERFLTEMFHRQLMQTLAEKDFLDSVLETAMPISTGLIKGEFSPEDLQDKIDDAVFSMLGGFVSGEEAGGNRLETAVERSLVTFNALDSGRLYEDIQKVVAGTTVPKKEEAEYRLLQKYLKAIPSYELKGADIVVYGKEKNKELFLEWIGFLRKMLPDLKVHFLEPNMILEEAERFTRSQDDAAQSLDEMDIEGLKSRLGLTNPFAVALGGGESGQTFPTAVSTTLLVRLLPEVFVMTADVDSPMADDVGPNRTFLIRSGWSPAEVHVAATSAAKLNLLELALYLTRLAAEKFPDEELYGRTYTTADLKELERLRDDFLTSSVPNITGFTPKGKLSEDEVPDSRLLAEEGKALGRRINESTDVWVLSALYIFATVALPGFGLAIPPVFAGLHMAALLATPYVSFIYLFAGVAAVLYTLALAKVIWRKLLGAVSSSHPMPKRYTAKVFARTTTVVVLLAGLLFAPSVMDALFYIHLAGPILPLLRRFIIQRWVDQNKRPLQDRMGMKKIVIISKNRSVGSLLEISMRKMFNQAYGINGVEVHSTTSYDALDEYSGDRSTWIIILDRDGRIPDAANTSNALRMIGKQIKTILSMFFPLAHLFGIPLSGAYILNISSNPNPALKASHRHITIDKDTHDPESMSKRRIVQEMFSESIDSFKQLLEGNVLLTNVARTVATPVWYRPWSYFVSWIWYRTHGGTGVHTTAQPYSADEIIPYLQKMPKLLRNLEPTVETGSSRLRPLPAPSVAAETPSASLDETPGFRGEDSDAIFPEGGPLILTTEDDMATAAVVVGEEITAEDADAVADALESPEDEAARLLRSLFSDGANPFGARSELRSAAVRAQSGLIFKLLVAGFIEASLTPRQQLRANRARIDSLRRNLASEKNFEKKYKLQRRLVTAYVRQLALIYAQQPAGPAREVEVQLLSAEMNVPVALGVLAVLRSVTPDKKRIYPKQITEDFEFTFGSLFRWPVIENPAKPQQQPASLRGQFQLRNAQAVTTGRIEEIRVVTELPLEFTGQLQAGGSNTGPTLSTVIKTVVKQSMKKAGYTETEYEISEPRSIYGQSAAAGGRVYQGMTASVSFQPLRSEARFAPAGELAQALEAKNSIKNETRRKEEEAMINAIREAEAKGLDLLGALDSFPKSTGIAAQFPATAPDGSGQFIFNYRAEDHGIEFVKSLFGKVANQPRSVEFMIFRDAETTEEEWQAMKTAVGPELRRMKTMGRKVSLVTDDRFTDFESFVGYRAKLVKADMPSVMQFVDPLSVTSKSKRYINRALLGAVPLANGRIVVAGSQKPIAGAKKFSIERVIVRSYQAMQILGRSA